MRPIFLSYFNEDDKENIIQFGLVVPELCTRTYIFISPESIKNLLNIDIFYSK